MSNPKTTDRQIPDYDKTCIFNISESFNDPVRVVEFKKNFSQFLISEEEDAVGDISQIVPESRPYNKSEYASILLNARSSRALCQKFELEPCGLVRSDAGESDFSLDEILNRMKNGHRVYKYHYNTAARCIVTLKINNGIIEIRESNSKTIKVSFSDMLGVILGSASSTFRLFKAQVDQKNGLLHESEDCFSIIEELRSYDFATTSSIAKLDIILSVSWLCTLNNSFQSCIPLSKEFLNIKIIKAKLKKEAHIRFISIVELFLLAIYKTLKQKDEEKDVHRVVKLLNKRFTFSGKFYRFIKFIAMPMILKDDFIKSKMTDNIRVNLLLSNRQQFLSMKLRKKEKVCDKLEVKMKKTVLESMLVPSTKSIFKKDDKKDPFLAMLRKKANK